MLITTYLFYPTITSLLFQTFSCEQIHLGRFLHQDYGIECDSAAHKRYKAMASIAIIAFSFGVPLLYFALLSRYRKNLAHADAQYLSFFFADYTDEQIAAVKSSNG